MKISRPFIIIIGLGFILAVGIGMILPKYQDLVLLRSKVQEKRAELQSEKEYFFKLKEASEELKKHEEALAMFREKFWR